LSRAERSIITLTALAILRQEDELATHLRAAIRNGLTPEQIREVLLQVGVYAGVPAANRAFAVAQRVLADSIRPEASGAPLLALRNQRGRMSGLRTTVLIATKSSIWFRHQRPQ